MNTPTRGTRSSGPVRFARVVGATLVTATFTIGLAACQPTTAADLPAVHRVAPVPPGVDLNRPADRIEEDIERLQAENCIQHVLVEHGSAWRLECIATAP